MWNFQQIAREHYTNLANFRLTYVGSQVNRSKVRNSKQRPICAGVPARLVYAIRSDMWFAINFSHSVGCLFLCPILGTYSVPRVCDIWGLAQTSHIPASNISPQIVLYRSRHAGSRPLKVNLVRSGSFCKPCPSLFSFIHPSTLVCTWIV